MKTLLFLLLAISINVSAFEPVVPGIYQDTDNVFYSVNVNNNSVVLIRLDFNKAEFHPFMGVQDKHRFTIDSIFVVTESRYEVQSASGFLFLEQISCKTILPVASCDYEDRTQFMLKRVF